MYQVERTKIEGLVVLTPKIFPDERGFFFESFNQKALQEVGIEFCVCQENHIQNEKAGVFRGLHFQNAPYGQAKLVRCIKGRVLDIGVDLRKNSPTYLQWEAVELTAENKKQFFLPKGFAHGVLSLEDDTEVVYETDEFWVPAADRTIRYDDTDIAISYPFRNLILSEKDRNAPRLKESDCNW